MSLLEVKNITQKYGNEVIIEDINMEIEEGETVSLLGMSGGGKTTLFNVISGLLRPESGQIILSGEDITGKAGHIGYMLQKDMLLDHKRIVDNVALPMAISGINKKEAREKASGFFEEFGLAGCEMKYPKKLSGGMRQRAALLRTYLCGRDVILLDEPFSALDAITKSEMHDWFLDITEKYNMTAVFVTHDIDEAIMLSDRIYILSGKPGRITAEYEIENKRPRHKDFAVSEEFLKYKKKIYGSLKFF